MSCIFQAGIIAGTKKECLEHLTETAGKVYLEYVPHSADFPRRYHSSDESDDSHDSDDSDDVSDDSYSSKSLKGKGILSMSPFLLY